MNSQILMLLLFWILVLPMTSEAKPNQMIETIIETARKSPRDLNDADLARVFLHLIEFPLEGFGPSDLLYHVESRERSNSYELSRALVLYYSDLQGGLFYVGEGRGYASAHLRAIQQVGRALALRTQDYDNRLERYGEFEDSSTERDMVSAMQGLIGESKELAEHLKEAHSEEQELIAKANSFRDLQDTLSKIDDRLKALRIMKEKWADYEEFS